MCVAPGAGLQRLYPTTSRIAHDSASPPIAVPTHPEACNKMRLTDSVPHLLRSLLLACFALLWLASPVQAQEPMTPSDSSQFYQYYRADATWFVRGLIGLDFYGGDRDINVRNELQKFIENIGPAFALDGGYSFTNRFSLSMQYFWARYPRIEDDVDDDGTVYARPAYGVIDASTTSKVRHHLTLLGRSYITPNRRVSPYGHLGLNVSFGKINDDLRIGGGPITGVGFDVAVSPRVGMYMELDGIYVFNDRALDFADTRSKRTPGSSEGIDASDFDAFTFLGFGVRVNMRSPFVPLNVECSGPMTLIPNEAGTFTASINEDATRPVDVHWDFTDGGVASGLIATHAFTEPGTYNVTVTASNRRSSDTATCPVTVLEAPTCAVSVSPQTLSMCSQPLPPCQFRSQVTGAAPFTYNWNFGDGGSSTQAEPSHTYVRTDAEPTSLTRTATLTVSNPAGTAQCSVAIVIEPCPCDPNFALAEVSFNRNESVIPDQGRQNLQDNLTVLRTNPSTIIVVQAFAQPNETDAQGLAEARARTVSQYYLDNGIDPNRVQSLGLVTLEGAKSGPVNTRTIPFCNESIRDAYIESQRQQFQR